MMSNADKPKDFGRRLERARLIDRKAKLEAELRIDRRLAIDPKNSFFLTRILLHIADLERELRAIDKELATGGT